MRLPLLASLVLISGVSCSSRSDDATDPAGVERSARLDASGSTVVASWTWAPASGADETRFRVSRDGGRTFGAVHSLGAWSSSATVSVTRSGRIGLFYRRVTDPNAIREGVLAAAIEAVLVDAASDAPSAPVTIEPQRFIATQGRGTSPTIAVTDRADGGWTLTHYAPTPSGGRLRVLTSTDGARWSSLETGTAFEMPANDTPLFTRCRGTSSRPFFVVTNFLEGRIVVRREAEAGRWPLDHAVDVVAPRSAPGADRTLPGRPDVVLPISGETRGCAVDGDRLSLLFEASERTSNERALWIVGVNISNGDVAAPTELPGSRKRFVDARIFAEGGRVFAAATAGATDRCDMLTWSGGATFGNPSIAVDAAPCGDATSIRYADGFGFAVSNGNALTAVTRFDDDSGLRGHVEIAHE